MITGNKRPSPDKDDVFVGLDNDNINDDAVSSVLKRIKEIPSRADRKALLNSLDLSVKIEVIKLLQANKNELNKKKKTLETSIIKSENNNDGKNDEDDAESAKLSNTSFVNCKTLDALPMWLGGPECYKKSNNDSQETLIRQWIQPLLANSEFVPFDSLLMIPVDLISFSPTMHLIDVYSMLQDTGGLSRPHATMVHLYLNWMLSATLTCIPRHDSSRLSKTAMVKTHLANAYSAPLCLRTCIGDCVPQKIDFVPLSTNDFVCKDISICVTCGKNECVKVMPDQFENHQMRPFAVFTAEHWTSETRRLSKRHKVGSSTDWFHQLKKIYERTQQKDDPGNCIYCLDNYLTTGNDLSGPFQNAKFSRESLPHLVLSDLRRQSTLLLTHTLSSLNQAQTQNLIEEFGEYGLCAAQTTTDVQSRKHNKICLLLHELQTIEEVEVSAEGSTSETSVFPSASILCDDCNEWEKERLNVCASAETYKQFTMPLKEERPACSEERKLQIETDERIKKLFGPISKWKRKLEEAANLALMDDRDSRCGALFESIGVVRTHFNSHQRKRCFSQWIGEGIELAWKGESGANRVDREQARMSRMCVFYRAYRRMSVFLGLFLIIIHGVERSRIFLSPQRRPQSCEVQVLSNDFIDGFWPKITSIGDIILEHLVSCDKLNMRSFRNDFREVSDTSASIALQILILFSSHELHLLPFVESALEKEPPSVKKKGKIISSNMTAIDGLSHKITSASNRFVNPYRVSFDNDDRETYIFERWSKDRPVSDQSVLVSQRQRKCDGRESLEGFVKFERESLGHIDTYETEVLPYEDETGKLAFNGKITEPLAADFLSSININENVTEKYSMEVISRFLDLSQSFTGIPQISQEAIWFRQMLGVRLKEAAVDDNVTLRDVIDEMRESFKRYEKCPDQSLRETIDANHLKINKLITMLNEFIAIQKLLNSLKDNSLVANDEKKT